MKGMLAHFKDFCREAAECESIESSQKMTPNVNYSSDFLSATKYWRTNSIARYETRPAKIKIGSIPEPTSQYGQHCQTTYSPDSQLSVWGRPMAPVLRCSPGPFS